MADLDILEEDEPKLCPGEITVYTASRQGFVILEFACDDGRVTENHLAPAEAIKLGKRLIGAAGRLQGDQG